MSEQNTDNVVKVAKRKSVTLTAGAGEKAMKLTILARRTGSGGEATVTTIDAKKKTTRGMTQKFESFEEAVEALGKLVKDATAKGWKKSERSGGFKARPDAFSAMPAAPKGSSK